MGPPVANQEAEKLALLYNEYIVYKTNQVKMRFLVHFDFEFK